MNYYFNNQIREHIIKYAVDQSPNEACGFIIKNTEYIFMPCTNHSPTPEKEFKLSGKDFIKASLIGKIECIIHSHNNSPWVSKEDIIEQTKHNIPFGVVFLSNGGYSHMVFWGDSLPVQDLLSRQFIHGVYDCYGLVRDFFRKEHRILLDNCPREMGWWSHKRDDDGNIITKAENLLIDGVLNQGFVEVGIIDIKPNDVLFFKIMGRYSNHSAIYLGNDLMLHHLFGKLSCREPLGQYKRFLTNIFRHERLF